MKVLLMHDFSHSLHSFMDSRLSCHNIRWYISYQGFYIYLYILKLQYTILDRNDVKPSDGISDHPLVTQPGSDILTTLAPANNFIQQMATQMCNFFKTTNDYDTLLHRNK